MGKINFRDSLGGLRKYIEYDEDVGQLKVVDSVTDNVIVIVNDNGDIEIPSASAGVILVDRTTGTKYRLYIDNGTLGIEVVS